MTAYQGGTVWLQVVPSFQGLQDSIRRGVSEAFAGAGVDKAAAKSFDGVEKQAGRAGEASARSFTGSFEKLTSNRIKQMAKDFSVLGRSLPDKEFRVIEARLARISKFDLSKVTNQAKAVDGLRRLRNEFQGMLDAADKGQRNLSDPSRWGLGFIRGQIDEINKGLAKATAPDPQAVKRQAELQKFGNLQVRAARELAAETQKRTAAEARGLREQFKLEQNRDKLRRASSKAEIDATNQQLRVANALAKFTERVAKGDRDAVALQIRAAKVLADFTARRQREEEKRWANQERAYAAMQREILQGVKELDREQQRAHVAQLARQAAEQKRGQLMARAQRENVQIDVEVDRQRIRQEMAAIRDEIRTLQTDVKVGADTAEANAKINALAARLNQLDRERVNIDVEVDTLGAMLQLRRLQSQVNSTGGARGAFSALLDAGSAANAVRVFNGVLFTTVTIGPLLIPVLAAISAGIFGVGAAALGAVFGVGALVAGLAGVGGAVGAMADLDKAKRLDRSGAGSTRDAAAERRQAITDARSVADAQKQLARARRDGARAIAEANRQVVDAEGSLARAHQDAAEAARDAAERTRDAEESLADAQRASRDAQLRLNEARRQARRDLIDLQNQLDSARLSERDAEFALEEAAVHLNVVLEDDQATQREKDVAQLAYDQAVEALEQQRLETNRLEVDTKRANKAGVEGSDQVKAAKDRINDASERVRDAEESLADAREAQARQAVDNARSIDDAERALSDARRARADAEISAAESVADAQLALARAHEDITLRSAQAAAGTDSLATAQDNLSESLRNLSPAAIAFATWLYSLRPLLRDIRFAAQEGLLPGLQEGLSAIIDQYGPSFVKFVGNMAGVLGDLASEFGNLLANDPVWQDFFATMADFGPVFLRQFGDVTINLLTAFASIMTAFAPFIAEMGAGLVSLTEGFADWAGGLEGSSPLQGFFEYLRSAGPEVGVLLGNIGTILTNLFIGLAPYADDLLQALIGMTDWLASMDPDELANLALGIGAIVLAVQALALGLSAISGVAGLIGGVVKLGGGVGKAGSAIAGALKGGGGRAAAAGAAPAAAGAIGGVGSAAKVAGSKLIGLLGPVGLVAGILWALWDAARWLDDQFGLLGGTTDDVSKGMSDAWGWLWRRGIKPIWDLISGVLDVMGQMFSTVGEIVSQVFRHIIAPAFTWLWENTIGPWWSKNVHPLLKKFGNYLQDTLPSHVRKGVNLIADIWNGLLDVLRTPIRAAIDIVWNKGIIGSFNWLAKRVPGMTPIDEIDIPASLYPGGKKFATGGILPGYTPGRDVHRFVSPTAGVLDLSGGEPILRPEAGKVLGRNWVDGINAAARGGGTSGVQRFLGYEAHAGGGFFGDILDKLNGLGGVLKNPLDFFDGVVDKSLTGWGVGGMFGDIIGPMVKSVPASIVDWIGDLIFGGDAKAPSGGKPAGAMGWQMMWELVSSQFPGANLHSAFRPGAITAVGTPSYHGQGRAIDITPSMEIFNWLARTFSNATELIFSPAGGRQLWNGNPYLFGEPTRGDHWDHIHWAMANGGIMPKLYDQGGDIPPGLSLIANATGKPEVTLTNKFVQEIRENMANGRGGPLVEVRDSSFGSDPAEVAYELDRLRRDKIALTGVFTEGMM